MSVPLSAPFFLDRLPMRVVFSAFELLGIVLLRFRLLPRVWAILLIVVNLSSVFFLDTLYGQVAFAVMWVGVVIMVWIYSKLGFVRLLGIGHVFWIPILVCFAMKLPIVSEQGWLSVWLVSLMIGNGISLLIDGIDVGRFVLGERKPHYSWN